MRSDIAAAGITSAKNLSHNAPAETCLLYGCFSFSWWCCRFLSRKQRMRCQIFVLRNIMCKNRLIFLIISSTCLHNEELFGAERAKVPGPWKRNLPETGAMWSMASAAGASWGSGFTQTKLDLKRLWKFICKQSNSAKHGEARIKHRIRTLWFYLCMFYSQYVNKLCSQAADVIQDISKSFIQRK